MHCIYENLDNIYYKTLFEILNLASELPYVYRTEFAKPILLTIRGGTNHFEINSGKIQES